MKTVRITAKKRTAYQILLEIERHGLLQEGVLCGVIDPSQCEWLRYSREFIQHKATGLSNAEAILKVSSENKITRWTVYKALKFCTVSLTNRQ